jgi:hypothetical protein
VAPNRSDTHSTQSANAEEEVGLYPPNQRRLLFVFQGLVLADVLQNCVFTGDEKDLVLKAIRKVRPHFQPNPTNVADEYAVPLLDGLNKDRIPSEVNGF